MGPPYSRVLVRRPEKLIQSIMSEMNDNPFAQYSTTPLTIALPSGDSARVPRCRYLFSPWQGPPIQETYGGKVVVESDGKPMFAELAILGVLQKSGWDGVWVDTYRKKFRRGLPPDCCELPLHAQKLYDRISLSNGKTSGCLDIFAWKEDGYLLVESKRRSKDVIQATQKAWIEAALRSDVPLDSLLICEWDLRRK
jgi:hypothetical protein